MKARRSEDEGTDVWNTMNRLCLPERTIKVTYRKLRCAGTRLAPITDNLLAWLTPLAKKSGSVWPIVGNWRERARSISDAQKETAERAGFPSWMFR